MGAAVTVTVIDRMQPNLTQLLPAGSAQYPEPTSPFAGPTRTMHRAPAVMLLAVLVGCVDAPPPTPTEPLVTAAPTPEHLAPRPPNDPASQALLESALTRLAALDLPEDPPPAPAPSDGTWTLARGGRVLAEGPMRRGMREGLWRRYDAGGQRIEEGRYHEDLPVGRWRRWRSDGTPMAALVYGPGACSEPPSNMERPMYCGTGFLRGWRPPADPAPLESFGVGEARRCVGRAEPWIVEGLTSPRENAWRVLLTAARSPELQGLVWMRVLADLERGEELHWFAQQMGRGAPEEREWITELALEHPHALLPALTVAVTERARTAPGFAARWYIQARQRARRGAPATMLGVLDRVIEALVEAEPALALPLTADASQFLDEDHVNLEGRLAMIRAGAHLDAGRTQEAGREIDRALLAFRLGGHVDPLAVVAPLRARWSAAASGASGP